MKEIPLTQGKSTLVDDEDFKNLSKFKWHANKRGNTHYAERMSARDKISHKRTSISMHAVIVGTPKGMDTDHINGNGLDNRKENLRIVTVRENQQNQHTHKSSMYPGVYWYNQTRKWKTQINSNGRRVSLGYYPNEEMAGLVYAMACNAIEMGAVL